MKFCKLLIISLFLTNQSVADDMQYKLFDKYVETQQYARISIHLDDKCDYFDDSKRATVEEASNIVSKLIKNHPLNKLGKSANLYIDVKMHARSLETECNDTTKKQVEDTLVTLKKFIRIIKNN